MTHIRVVRRFVNVGGRAVHVRIMGHGPPALFIHSSPANSSYVVNDMAVVADSYTCFAFDTPGFGLSDALPGDCLTVAQLADALAETLDAVGMPPCPAFGTHTGASIALELAVRHPAQVTGLVLDGLASFTEAEHDALFGDYFTVIPVDPLGGHYSAAWTRFRDQSTWFPWSVQSPDTLNDNDLYPPKKTHRWVTMYFDAADTYVPAYRAALSYRDGPTQVAALSCPAIFTAIESDMLYAHLDRIQPQRASQEIRRVGAAVADRRALTHQGFDRFGSEGVAPKLSGAVGLTPSIGRQFIDVGDTQLLVRFLGDPAHPAILIIHDVPGDGGGAEALVGQLARERFVIAFDLPGCGETPALNPPYITTIVELLWSGCDAVGCHAVDLFGIGFGSSIAIEMAALSPHRVTSLTLDGLLLADDAERDELRAHFAPAITIQADGSHWFRTWQMIRDMGIWWPWYQPAQANLLRVEGDFDALSLHRRTCATMRQPGAHAAVVNAALAQDAVARLAQYSGPVRCIANSVNPLATAFHARAVSSLTNASWIHIEEAGR